MTDSILIPGGRDVRATLDVADEGDEASVVVACPPHPEHGGHRGDVRLQAVSDGLVDRGIDCLRFDYGSWDDGYGESTDADNAVGWALDRYDRVGLFGFSFGGCIALVTAAERPELAGVCALAPPARLHPDVDATEALATIADRETPTLLVFATRDTTADWQPVADDADRFGLDTIELKADHFFVGRESEMARPIVDFFEETLARPG